jgi:ABC-type spermidine/putrescine transport system permease subunit II
MNGTSELIVGLWFLPVTVFILIPLFMLVAWSLAKLSGRILGFMKKPISSVNCHILEPNRTTK